MQRVLQQQRVGPSIGNRVVLRANEDVKSILHRRTHFSSQVRVYRPSVSDSAMRSSNTEDRLQRKSQGQSLVCASRLEYSTPLQPRSAACHVSPAKSGKIRTSFCCVGAAPSFRFYRGPQSNPTSLEKRKSQQRPRAAAEARSSVGAEEVAKEA